MAGAACLALSASAAQASHPAFSDEGIAPTGEAELRAAETRILGAEHAAEHAAARRAHSEVAQPLDVGQPQSEAIAPRAAGPANEVGQWTTAPFPVPTYGIHAAMLPTGKVLIWGYPPYPEAGGPRPLEGTAALWNPALGTGPASMRNVPPPHIDVDGDGDTEPAPIYCSGQSFLPSGELLVAGGNLIWPDDDPDDEYDDYAGIERVFTFDPWTESWTEQPQMEKGRWYPSQVLLADGRSAILGGYDETSPGANHSTQLEVFTPAATRGGVGTVARQPSGDRRVSLYPHMFVLPDRRVLLAGPELWDTAILDPGPMSWSDLPNPDLDRFLGNSVLLPGGPDGSWTVTQIGGHSFEVPPEPDGTYQATATTETMDVSEAGPEWRAANPLSVARSNSNTVLLPDGSMVLVGGGRGFSLNHGNWETYPDGRARQVELWDSASGTWRLGPAQQEDRAYHSTALLLPDGRVMSSGDDYHMPLPDGRDSRSDTAEIYSPPYLFKGQRPTISGAPAHIRWADRFQVSTSSDVRRVVLMAPSAVTHGADMHQRHVELQVNGSVPGEGVNVSSPPSAAVAPPGHYMMFALDSAGVPSVARWIELRADSPDQPELTPRDLAGPVTDLAGPVTSLRLRRHPARKPFTRTGRIMSTVSANEPSTIALRLTVQSRKGKALASRRAELRFDRAGEQSVKTRFGRSTRRKAGRSPIVRVEVQATDGAGNAETSRLRLRAGR